MLKPIKKKNQQLTTCLFFQHFNLKLKLTVFTFQLNFHGSFGLAHPVGDFGEWRIWSFIMIIHCKTGCCLGSVVLDIIMYWAIQAGLLTPLTFPPGIA